MEWLVTCLIGGGVVLFGLFFLWRHQLFISRLRVDQELPDRQMQSLISQQRRRMLTSILVIFSGVLIPVSYDAIVRQKNPWLASIVLLVLLGLVLVVAFLAVADLLSGRCLHADLQLRKAEAELKRRLLEQDLERYRSEGRDLR